MNYLIIFSVRNFTTTINRLVQCGVVGKIAEGIGQSMVLDVACGVGVQLMRVEGEVSICSVELYADDLSEAAVIEEVMLLLNNNGFAVSEAELVLYRKYK